MLGLARRAGGFATKVIRGAFALGQTIAETIGMLERHDIPVAPEPTVRDWGRVATADALSPRVTKLSGEDLVPRELFVRSDIPWSDPYAYEVSIFGRDRATGQFRRQKLDMTMSERFSIDEIVAEAHKRFGDYEKSMFSEIWDVAVTGAWMGPETIW